MNESSLRELIHASGDAVQVSPPPHAAIAARARARRSRTLTVGAVIGTAAVIVAIVAVQQSLTDSESTQLPPTTQSPSPTPSQPPRADFRGIWRVETLVTTDPMIHDLEGSITDTYVQPQGLNVFLSQDQWRAAVRCDYMSGGLRVTEDRWQHQDPVRSGEDVCPKATEEYAAIVNYANVMMRVQHWSLSEGKLQLTSGTGKLLAVLAANGEQLPCSPSEQSMADLDTPGPGQPSPESAAAPLTDDFPLAINVSHGSATVIALTPDGTVTRVYEVTKREDGWWPDAYSECR